MSIECAIFSKILEQKKSERVFSLKNSQSSCLASQISSANAKSAKCGLRERESPGAEPASGKISERKTLRIKHALHVLRSYLFHVLLQFDNFPAV